MISMSFTSCIGNDTLEDVDYIMGVDGAFV